MGQRYSRACLHMLASIGEYFVHHAVDRADERMMLEIQPQRRNALAQR